VTSAGWGVPSFRLSLRRSGRPEEKKALWKELAKHMGDVTSKTKEQGKSKTEDVWAHSLGL